MFTLLKGMLPYKRAKFRNVTKERTFHVSTVKELEDAGPYVYVYAYVYVHAYIYIPTVTRIL